MTEKLILNPPEIIDTHNRMVFLAGPIQGAPNWQPDAAKMIHNLDSTIVVASPRKDYDPGTFVYERQVDWETHFLRKTGEAGVIAFWLANQTVETPGRSYAQTTRFELAEWKMRHEYEGVKVVVGIEEGFGNERYIRRRLSQDTPGIPISNSLEQMTSDAVDLLR